MSDAGNTEIMIELAGLSGAGTRCPPVQPEGRRDGQWDGSIMKRRGQKVSNSDSPSRQLVVRNQEG